MITGKLNQIHKDHREWIAEIELLKTEITFLTKLVQKNPNLKEGKFQNDLDHHRRLLDKLMTSIQSHKAFLAEMAIEDIRTMEMLDIEGHNRNKAHFKNLDEGFKKLRHDILHLSGKNAEAIH
ncbi:hypothetical protein HZR84_11790 [Hyphobacterium sp. CCMP332]|nr:hypothetical protein HZR84_11790 [Hyphobacterium sp. CCMP332]